MSEIKLQPETRVIKVRPKQVPVVCPVCHNFGTLRFGAVICHGCSGKGWILVDAEEVK